ncbi:MAG TPA: polyprenol monophosphomannose synthase [Syntrophobacteria bacterium]|nr:polyprenol monophosphomannose synthase [Syntrophobacteria bacterium]
MVDAYTTSDNIFVVLPTYNERENLRLLLPIILKKGPNVKVLVVDDNSPDGTGAMVAEMAKQNDRIFVLRRPGKMGLGTAYVAGFKWVLANSDAQFVFEMDADFSHNPDRIPDFIKKVKQDNDLVVGSRYLKGVSVVNWPIRRLILSYGASIYARHITGIPLRDQTTGYKCFRRQVLEAIDLDRIYSDGYAFQIEINYRAMEKGFRLSEVPIIFEERYTGASKMSRRIFLEAMWVVWRLRLRKTLGRLTWWRAHRSSARSGFCSTGPALKAQPNRAQASGAKTSGAAGIDCNRGVEQAGVPSLQKASVQRQG